MSKCPVTIAYPYITPIIFIKYPLTFRLIAAGLYHQPRIKWYGVDWRRKSYSVNIYCEMYWYNAQRLENCFRVWA